MKKIAFFNNKGGVGKTTFAFHIGYMLEKLGKRVLFVDLDPQCNLTAHILNDEEIDKVWSDSGSSIYDAVEPIISGSGDVKFFSPHKLENRDVWLYAGDLLLSDYEGLLSEAWTQVLAGQERGYRASSAITRLVNLASSDLDIDYVIFDVGPNFGALNRAVLLDCDNIFVPMVPDLFSLRGSQNLGRVLSEWIRVYSDAMRRVGDLQFDVPHGKPKFSGYVLQQFNNYRNRKTKAWDRWGQQVPEYINKYVVIPLGTSGVLKLANYQLGEFKNYHSLIPMAQDAQKPIYELTSQDGVVGGHHEYVKNCNNEFRELALKFIEIVD
ncbi:ParA family protein [Shewanella sp. HN-41]|uniref:ParA family protein n=1 Tax=Shewanella sp. HN-41 TaxID=327275 RepID=UPI000212619D|nr:ParA family protein [Shewanella sp. HN-41]EGM68694.1 phage regulatory protein cII [Shewanella sp. HN-41]